MIIQIMIKIKFGINVEKKIVLIDVICQIFYFE